MRTLVIGIGNRDRGDDAVGQTVADVVARANAPGIETLRSRGDPAELIEAWTERRRVIVVDACTSGAPAGTVHRFDARQAPLPSHFEAVSTHGFGLATAVETARAMASLPDALVVYGIEAANFEAGAPLTDPVAAAAQTVAASILSEVAVNSAAGETPCMKQA